MRLGEWLKTNDAGAAYRLATMLCVNRSTVSRWVTGERMPSALSIEAIAKYTNLSVGASDWPAAEKPTDQDLARRRRKAKDRKLEFAKRAARIQSMRRRGMTTRTIAAEFGISQTMVMKILGAPQQKA